MPMEQHLPPCSKVWPQTGSAVSNCDHLHFEGGLFVCGEYLFRLSRLHDRGGALDHRVYGIDACVHGITLRRSWVEGFCISDMLRNP